MRCKLTGEECRLFDATANQLVGTSPNSSACCKLCTQCRHCCRKRRTEGSWRLGLLLEERWHHLLKIIHLILIYLKGDKGMTYSAPQQVAEPWLEWLALGTAAVDSQSRLKDSGRPSCSRSFPRNECTHT